MGRIVPEMDATQSAAWIALVSLAEQLPHALDAQLARDSGLINFEYGILTALGCEDGHRLRMGDLAVAVWSPAPRLSKAVRRLERRGLVERVTSGCRDGRAVDVRLTPEGLRLWLEATPPHIAFARDTLLAALSPEQLAQVAEFLAPVLKALVTDRADGSSGS